MRLAALAVLTALLLTAACSSKKEDTEPTVTVQLSPVEKQTIQHTVTTQAILFPKQQAAIVPKITAPVQKFLVKRGSPVREGQLLAVLENRDLSAAAQDTKGAYEQAQATYETTPRSISIPCSRSAKRRNSRLPPVNCNRPRASTWARRRS